MAVGGERAHVGDEARRARRPTVREHVVERAVDGHLEGAREDDPTAARMYKDGCRLLVGLPQTSGAPKLPTAMAGAHDTTNVSTMRCGELVIIMYQLHILTFRSSVYFAPLISSTNDTQPRGERPPVRQILRNKNSVWRKNPRAPFECLPTTAAGDDVVVAHTRSSCRVLADNNECRVTRDEIAKLSMDEK